MIKEINARQIIASSKSIDSWFLGKYRIGVYRGCQHACVYCDGRAERYYFEGEFGSDVEIKANAIELLRKELPRMNEPGFLFLGSGITDAYQPLEQKYQLNRRMLEIIADNPLPIQILTKSALVQRDLPLLREIARKKRVILSFSITCDEERTRMIFEPNTAPIQERWETLKAARELGLSTGVLLMPAIPHISDSSEELERIFERARDYNVDYLLCSGMTLKPGRQKTHFLNCIEKNYPDIKDKIVQIYKDDDPYGHGPVVYYARLNHIFARLARQHKIPLRIPRKLFRDVLPRYTEAAILLAHIGEFLEARGISRKSYAIANFAIQKWAYEEKKKISRKKDFHYRQIEALFEQKVLSGEIKQWSGIGDVIYKMLHEYVETGTIQYYEQLSGEYPDK